MSFVNGLLGLGVGIVSGAITEPVSGTNYNRVPISFDIITGGVTLNVVNGVFGPVSGTGNPWGTLSVFQIFDQYGNPGFYGTLQSSLTPVPGEQIYVPVGTISLAVNAQLPASGAASGLQPVINVPAHTILGNPTSGATPPQYLPISAGLAFTSASGLYVTPATAALLGGVIASNSPFLVDALGNLSLLVASGLAIGASGLTNTGVLTFNGGNGNVVFNAESIVALLGYTPASTASFGVANGIATLNSVGTVPLTQLPASISTGRIYQGTWNAATNTPTLANGTGVSGQFYICTVSGVALGNTYNVGDQPSYASGVWQLVPANPGIGTMAAQNANAVNITGGSVTGLAALEVAGGPLVTPISPLIPQTWAEAWVGGASGTSLFGGIDVSGNLIVGGAMVTGTLAAATGKFTSLIATGSLIATETISAASPLGGLQYALIGLDGRSVFGAYDTAGVWHFQSVAVQSLTVSGSPVSPGGETAGVPSYATDVTASGFGGVGDGREGWFYASWVSGGANVTISKFVGSVSATGTTLAIVGTAGNGIAFRPGIDDGKPIWLQGMGSGGADLITSIVQVTDGQTVTLAAAPSTVPSGNVGAVWPCFTSGDAGKVIWIAGAEVKNYWVDAGPTLTQDLTQTYGVQPLMANIGAVTSATGVTLTFTAGGGVSGFPLTASGIVTRIAWFTDNAAAIGAAANAAQQADEKYLYFPGASKLYGSASLMKTGNVYRSWFGPHLNQPAILNTLWLGDNWRGGFHVDTGGRRLWQKQIPVDALSPPAIPRTANLRKQAPNLSGKTSLHLTIIGASLGLTNPTHQSPMWFEADMFWEKFLNDNTGVAIAKTNYSIGGSSIATLDNNTVYTSKAPGYPWYTNATGVWFNYLLTQSPPPDVIYIPLGGLDDGMGFHPIHLLSVINRIHAAIPSGNIIWQTMNCKGIGIYTHESDQPALNAYSTGYIRGVCWQLGIPLVDYGPHSERVNFGWDQMRRRERIIPALTATVSSGVPWSINDVVRDFGGMWVLGSGITGSGAWASLKQLNFQLSPREDNLLSLWTSGANLWYSVQDWGGSVLTPCILASGGTTLTTSGQASYTGNLTWNESRSYVKLGDPAGPLTSGNLGNCLIFPTADANNYNQRTFLTHIINSFAAWTPDCPGSNNDTIIATGTAFYGGMMFVPADGTAQPDCVITDASGRQLITKITGYTSQNQVTLRDPWPYASLVSGTPATVWVGRYSVPPTQSSVLAGSDTGIGPLLNVGVKGRRLTVCYTLGGFNYVEPPIVVDTIIPRLSGEFVPLVWSTGSGTLAGTQLWIDEDDFSLPGGTFFELLGVGDINADGLYGGSGGHEASVNAETIIRPVLEAQDFAF